MSYPFSKDLELAVDEEMVWLSAQEIADLAKAGKLFGWPKSASSIRKIANREGWARTSRARWRKGRGGGLEYHIKLLGSGGVWGLALVALDTLATDEALLARFVAVGLSAQIQREFWISQILADCIVSDAIEAGSLPLPDCLGSNLRSATPRTIRRWRQMMRSGMRMFP